MPSDSSGVLLVKVIQTRRTSQRRHALVGSFLKVVLKSVKPELWKKRKKRVRAITIRTKMFYYKKDGLSYRFSSNALVLLKKRMNTLGREIFGPTSKSLKIKKFRVAFKHIY
ncbi:UNVERIFIED_CONTAM: hypothetical protein GTU68_019654 [Idotea baltica]|nr:hypothetical protein [Idotea baltica]